MNVDPASHLTIREAQTKQPWAVPYSEGVNHATSTALVPHLLGTHCVMHAAKTIGKMAAVFEALDHSGELPDESQLATIRAMAADLLTEALRFANLYEFDLAAALIERVKEKNGTTYCE